MRLFADECIPIKAFRSLVESLGRIEPPVEAVHLLERFVQGRPDDEWTLHLARDNPRWLVLSADRHRRGRAVDPRLPVILPALRISSVFFTPTTHQWPAARKAEHLMALIDDLRAAWAHAPGTRHRLALRRDQPAIEVWPPSKAEASAITSFRQRLAEP
ncbi:MAG: hypothetical protein ACKVW3_01435 [Phycisphaerales bacterium]